MPTFRYRAVSGKEGNIQRGVIEAPSRELAVAKLQSAGHLPISAEEIGAGRTFDVSRYVAWWHLNKVTPKNVALITRELAILVQAGLTLEQSLQTISRLKLSAPIQRLLDSLLEAIRGGASLSDAMAGQAGVFSNIYISMVRAGESSGSMDIVIARLADYLERMSGLRSQILTALVYPLILLALSLLSLFVLMTLVVPEFVPLFADAGQALPWLTQGVFAFSSLFQRYWWGLLVLLAVTAWLINKILSKPSYRLRFDTWCLHLPYIGMVIQYMEMARFSRTLSTALTNGVPLLAGVRLVKEVLGNRRMAEVMEAVSASLEQGESVAKPLKESGVCPELATQLIEVGEAGGQLDAMLTKIADIYDDEVQVAIKRLLTILEPALILGLGVLIALIIISILLAVLSLNTLVV